MSVLVLCNIGNSDLRVTGMRVQRPRTEGQSLFATFDQQVFELPIIEPCLRAVLRDVPQIDQVILFVTDQPDTPETRVLDRQGIALRDKDTIWFGRIAERLLRDRFGDALGAIGIVPIMRGNGQSINPSMYDDAFDAYGDMIGRHYVTAATRCYVLMAGGIPACNTALQLQAISAYADRCRTMYQPEGGQPYELRVGTQVLTTYRRAAAIAALERRNFAAALALLEGVAQPAIIELVRYAHFRECFDFERAQQQLAAALRDAGGELRTFLTGMRGDLDDLIARENIGALLRELLANAEITYRNERYADFLGRVFRFQEAALRAIVETKLGLLTDMSKAKEPTNGPAFRQGIADDPGLKAALDAQQIDNKPLRYDTPNLPTMQAMLRYITHPDSRRPDGTPYLDKVDIQRYREAYKLLNKIASFAQLRNQSVIAHGFAGISHERLAEQYGDNPDTLLADLRKVLELINLPIVSSPFDRIADVVMQMIRRGAA